MEDTLREPEAWQSYSVYGITLRTNHPIVAPLPAAGNTPDLTFSCVTAPPPEAAKATPELLCQSTSRLPSGEPWVSLYRAERFDLMHFAEVVDFYLFSDRILGHLLDPEYSHVIEIYLLGGVLAFWCERAGTPMLHASAVVVDGRAVAFVSTNKGGKSSLAAELMGSGYPLLTDDLLRIHPDSDSCRADPGYPEMRFWPRDAERLLGQFDQLKLAHPAYSKRRIPVGGGGFGAFCAQPQPLGCLYLPLRRASQAAKTSVEIDDVPPRRGIVELIRGSFVPHWVKAAGLDQSQFHSFSRLVSRVPLRTITYPAGIEHLPSVRKAILHDLRQRPSLAAPAV